MCFGSYQGVQNLKTTEVVDAHGHKIAKHELELVTPGKMNAKEYDIFVGDLVNYLAYMGEPAQKHTYSAWCYCFIFLIRSIRIAFIAKE